MAVKKHEFVHDNRNPLDLNALAQYIQLINEQPNYLPPPNELVKNCQDIVKCLARTVGTSDELWSILQSVEEFLHLVINSVHSSLRHEIVTAILDKFYSFISDPQSDAYPATSVVLVVLDNTDNEAILSAARWLVQQRENGPAGEGFRASLSCLYRWLGEWHGTPLLGDWVMAYIKALEETERYDILIEVTIDNIGRLFQSIEDPPNSLRQSVADVIFHVLACLRESVDAFDRISPYVGRVLMNLAADNGRWSRQLLQNVVDILTAMSENLLDKLNTQDDQDMFKDKYADVFICLGQHMTSHGYRGQTVQPWRARSNQVIPAVSSDNTMRKVGLLNLGNTCYMNSVLQALFYTKNFSIHVVMRKGSKPYWSKLGNVFAQMMFTISTKVNPEEFFAVVQSPFFTIDRQHDCSEFLGYLFELLQTYEFVVERNFNYSRASAAANRIGRMIPPANFSSSSDDIYDNGNRRSISPRPGSSTQAATSTGSKRRLRVGSERQSKRLRSNSSASVPQRGPPAGPARGPTAGPARGAVSTAGPARRRSDSNATPLRRGSFIDKMFGGVLLTRIECTECHTPSLSRDVFRDLQLAFPEKPEGYQYSVQSLLEYYCSKEKLCGANQYKCNDCGILRDAERSVLIETTPKYLILVLKNFKFEPKLQVQKKLIHEMYYNEKIVLPTVRSQAEHATYVLYAAIIHVGTTLDSGHYYTLVKDEDDEWNVYNDDIVTATSVTELYNHTSSCSPYMLFYRRTDITETRIPTIENLPKNMRENVRSHNIHQTTTYVDNACQRVLRQ